MGLTYRGDLGRALTVTEIDNNFRHFTGSHDITGSLKIKGDLNVSGSIIGNIDVTSSLAISASHAVYSDTASFIAGGVVSSSYAETASFLAGGIESASYAETASYAHSVALAPTQTGVTASLTSISSSTILSYGQVNLISADATDYAVRLPQPRLGGVVNVVNRSSVDVHLFPYDSASAINGLNDGEHFVVPADDSMYSFTCVRNPSVGVWSVSTPIGSNSVVKSVTVDLQVDATSPFNDNGGKYSNAIVDGALLTYNGVSFLRPPQADTAYFQTSEFDTYNQVRINKVNIKTNVPAGDGTAAGSQTGANLLGITPAQFARMFGWIRQSAFDEANNIALTSNLLNSNRFENFYSANIANGFPNPAWITHYLGADGLFYQQLTFTTGYNVGTSAGGWQDLRDSNNNRRVFYGPYLAYGDNSAPASGYPVGFELEATMVVEFEFK